MKISLKQKFIYRAVSNAELRDIEGFGLRSKPGAYETVKLFALNYDDADSFGKINQFYDRQAYTVVKIAIPKYLLEEAFSFEPDGMKAISIEEKDLPC